MKRTTHTERWKPVVGYEGLYEVSSWGRVRSLDRVVIRSNGRSLTIRGKVLTPTPNSSGYPAVDLRGEGRRRMVTVHRLVAEAFLGPCPPGREVLHLDDDRSNPEVRNLRYGTRTENNLQCVRHGRHNNGSKTRCPRGHTYDDENTYRAPSGQRVCRRCRRENRTSQNSDGVVLV